MRLSALGAVLVCLSCKFSEKPRAHPAESREKGAEELDAERDEHLRAMASLRERFGRELPDFGDSERRRCPDEQLGVKGQSELPVRVLDERLDRRQLLPLRFATALTSASPARARTYLDPMDAFTQAKLSEMSANADEAAEVARLSALRHLAELRVDVYKTPKLFRRKDAPRSEWSPGVLLGRLVIFDLFEAKPLCQAPIEVHISGEGEPIRKRLRDVVRERMTTELERRTRLELERGLVTISSAFSLEPSPNAAPTLALARLSP